MHDHMFASTSSSWVPFWPTLTRWRVRLPARDHRLVASGKRNLADRTRPLWRIGNRIEAFQLRHFGFSPMSLLNRGDVMVLETVGRRTGRARFAPVGYWDDGHGTFVIGGGAAGMATVPDWVMNLRQNPQAAAWLHRSRIPVCATELTGAERDRAQQHATKIWPGVPTYERRSGRVIPYFQLKRNAHQ
jgi:deazaflavin-dependent oxidoreductase (nitroreductase family)